MSGSSLPTANRQPLTASNSSPGWTAELKLKFAPRASGTYLAERSHRGPLLVQRPFYPEGDVCHAYVVHPPGGVVGGDRLELDVDVAAGAHALLTTPAAAKFYRSEAAVARQRVELRVAGGVLEWLPQETIFYPDARVRSATEVHLSGTARFVGWDVACLGLPARGQRFDRGELRLDLALHVDGAPRFIDRLRIAGGEDALAARWGFAGHEAFGTLLAWPATRVALDAVRVLELTDCELAATLVDGVLAVRCLGAQAEPIKRAFIRCWQRIRPLLLGREAMEPRIWAT